jgi:3-phenylpropionate/trans-cinnamate dioxygenase ferredoxin reductase subunit
MLGADASVVIVGGGQAGFQAASSLREGGYEGRLVLIGDEACLPYQRPPLSKAHLKGEPVDADLCFRPDAFFADRRIELKAPERAVAIDRAARRVALASGASIGYDHLVLATGSRPRKPAWPGIELRGVHLLRTLDDARDMRATLTAAKHVVIVGAGFIGLEVASTAGAAGAHVAIVEVAERPLVRALSKQMAQHLVKVHEGRGVEFHFGTSVAAIEGAQGRATAVRTTDGRRLDADLVLVAIGVQANDELAAAAGLAVDNGIVVDAQLQTEDPHVSAIGDCARYPSAHHPGAVRLESVQNAVDHGRTLAARLTGHGAPYDKLPWFWSDQGDLRLQMCGLALESDDAVLRGDPASGRFSVLRYRGEQLVAAETVNQPAEHLMIRKIMAAGAPLPRAVAADAATKLVPPPAARPAAPGVASPGSRSVPPSAANG